MNFNPRAPCGARPIKNEAEFRKQIFQSTRPVRGATSPQVDRDKELLFQSTRPVRGATSEERADVEIMLFQSTRPVRGAT